MAMDERSAEQQQGAYDPERLSSPQVFLLSMIIFLALAGFVAAILFRQISSAFATNPGLNGLILGVLAVGILLAFMQVIRLFREVRWVNSFRQGETARDPVLLAPMQAMLSRNTATSLSTASMRSILDSIATRLDESRDISRYLIGLLVFLGLLGTFWGLLQTIGSIGDTIQSLDPSTGDANDTLNALKSGLARPLDGMGTAFSSSLFGLAGSLVLGFLDLQAGQAQNMFYNDLEDWLSTVTDLDPELLDGRGGSNAEDFRLAIERLSRIIQEGGMQQQDGGSTQRATTAMANLAEGIQGLVQHMRTEQQVIRSWVETQSEQQRDMQQLLETISRALQTPAAGE